MPDIKRPMHAMGTCAGLASMPTRFRVQAFPNSFPIITTIVKRLGLANSMSADDIAQDAATRAWLSRAQFRGNTEREHYNWLYKIVVNTARDANRRSLAQRYRSATLEESITAEVLSQDYGPYERAALAEESSIICRVIDLLPSHYQKIIRLRFYCGDRFSAIASLMQLDSDNAARFLLRRALRCLRTFFLQAASNWGGKSCG